MDLISEISQEKWQEVADTLGLGFTAEQVKESNLPSDLLLEIIEDDYDDTDQLEQIMDHVSLHYIGMDCPTYGDEKEYNIEFYRRLSLFKKGEWSNDDQ